MDKDFTDEEYEIFVKELYAVFMKNNLLPTDAVEEMLYLSINILDNYGVREDSIKKLLVEYVDTFFREKEEDKSNEK